MPALTCQLAQPATGIIQGELLILLTLFVMCHPIIRRVDTVLTLRTLHQPLLEFPCERLRHSCQLEHHRIGDGSATHLLIERNRHLFAISLLCRLIDGYPHHTACEVLLQTVIPITADGRSRINYFLISFPCIFSKLVNIPFRTLFTQYLKTSALHELPHQLICQSIFHKSNFIVERLKSKGESQRLKTLTSNP